MEAGRQFRGAQRSFFTSGGSEVIIAGIMAPLHPLPRPGRFPAVSQLHQIKASYPKTGGMYGNPGKGHSLPFDLNNLSYAFPKDYQNVEFQSHNDYNIKEILGQSFQNYTWV